MFLQFLMENRPGEGKEGAEIHPEEDCHGNCGRRSVSFIF